VVSVDQCRKLNMFFSHFWVGIHGVEMYILNVTPMFNNNALFFKFTGLSITLTDTVRKTL